MDSNDLIKGLKNIDSEKLSNAGDTLSKVSGISKDKINDFFSDKSKISEIASKLTSRDLEKISKMLEDPEAIKKALSSNKAKENLKKFLD